MSLHEAEGWGRRPRILPPQKPSVAVIIICLRVTYESPYDGLHRVIEHELIHRHKDILKHLVVCLRPQSYSQGLVSRVSLIFLACLWSSRRPRSTPPRRILLMSTNICVAKTLHSSMMPSFLMTRAIRVKLSSARMPGVIAVSQQTSDMISIRMILSSSNCSLALFFDRSEFGS